MSLQIVRRKLLFSPQNIHSFEKFLCQQGAAITQECSYHALSADQGRSNRKEKGRWRGYSSGGQSGTTSPSVKAGYGIVALTAGAAIGEFY